MSFWLASAWLLIAGFIGFIGAAFVIVIFWGLIASDAPWVPQTRRGLEIIIRMIGALPVGATVVDMGSGDGRILRAIARRNPNIRAIGLEQSYVLTAIARLFSRRYGQRIRYHRGDFLQYPLAGTDVVTCYLWTDIMPTLGEKFRRELASGSRVISVGFPIPDWRPTRIEAVPNVGTFYEYRVNETVEKLPTVVIARSAKRGVS